MMLRLILSDDLWNKLAVHLLPPPGRRGRPSERSRIIVEGILWRLRTGAPWRDLPDAFGPWSTVFSRFSRWSKNGVWEAFFNALQTDVDTEWHFVDSTLVRVHQHGAGARKGEERAIGTSRGGPTTKIHTIADGLGNPLRFLLTGGQVHDSQPFDPLLSGFHPDYLIADKGYDAAWIRAVVEKAGGCPVIPQRQGGRAPNPHFDRAVYKARHVIENLFAKMKPWRALATRYEKTARNFLAVVHIVAAFIWIR